MVTLSLILSSIVSFGHNEDIKNWNLLGFASMPFRLNQRKGISQSCLKLDKTSSTDGAEFDTELSSA